MAVYTDVPMAAIYTHAKALIVSASVCVYCCIHSDVRGRDPQRKVSASLQDSLRSRVI